MLKEIALADQRSEFTSFCGPQKTIPISLALMVKSTMFRTEKRGGTLDDLDESEFLKKMFQKHNLIKLDHIIV